MVTRQLEPEVEEIFRLVDEGKNFLLSGGAGSGKTYSLVQFIKEIIERNPTVKIACMTYTNSAVKEIEERVNHSNLQVTTIHDFLWNTIKKFQKEIKKSLIELINDDSVDKISSPDDEAINVDYYDDVNKIEYLEFTNIKDGVISHDAIIVLVNYMFKEYPKLSDILKDRFNYILIDEYQDTDEKVVEILLTYLKQSNRKNIIGFFGDAMQSIYANGIGDLNEYLNKEVFEVPKRQNRRNPKAIIELANRLRTDGLEQQPSTDSSAPNMKKREIKKGSIEFYYSTKRLENLNSLKATLMAKKNPIHNWDFENVKETKELNLTHNLIATKAGFRELMDIYNNDPILKLKDKILQKIKNDKKNNKPKTIFDKEDSFDIVLDIFQFKKDLILADEKTANLFNQLKDFPFSFIQKFKFSKNNLIDKDKFDPLIKILFTIQHNIKLYQNKKYNEFLRQTNYTVTTIEKKQDLKNIIDKLETMSEESIKEVISYAGKKKLCNIEDDKYKNFIDEKAYIYNQVKNFKYRVFQNLYDYVEEYTPFSTQHKVKGAEFNNVLVVLDNGKWNDYNFKNLFLEEGKESVLNRTQKIFYVCCTRAKENLVVFYDSPSDEVIEKAKEWFGEDNVTNIY